MEKSRMWAALAGVNGLMAVAAGAFGAHGVHDVDVRALLHTGSQYQAMHAVAALACLGLLGSTTATARWTSGLFGMGGLIFGGSLYILALSGVKLWGAVTPVGGLLLLAGWAVVIWAALAGRMEPTP